MKCQHCGNPLGSRYHALERRTERLQWDTDPAPMAVTCHVLAADTYPMWCSQKCWQAEAPIVLVALNYPYPTTSPTTPCSLCGKPVDRRKPHVTVSILDMEQTSKPWLESATVHDDITLAVMCNYCQSSGIEEESRPRERRSVA